MPRRAYRLYSTDVARESLRTGKVAIASDPDRQKRVRAAVKEFSDKVIAGTDESGDMPSYMLHYGVDGVAFTVVVYERKRWYVADDVDGVEVMANGADGKQRTEHFTARFDDLPAAVRAVARDVQAGLKGKETAASKVRARRRQERNDAFERDMRRNHPTWYPNGVFDREVMRAELAETQAMFDRQRERRLDVAREVRERAAQARAEGRELLARRLDDDAQEIEDAERVDAVA